MENEEIKFESIDKVILLVIILATIVAIIGTVAWVKYKHIKNPYNGVNIHLSIENNDIYQYSLDDGQIVFYHGSGEVATYDCKASCMIPKYEDNQFLIKKDTLIPIIDDNNFMLFDIDKKAVFETFDNYPKTTYINDLGLVSVDGLFAVINSKGKILSDYCNNIDMTNNYILTLKDKKLSIYDKNMNDLTANSKIEDVVTFVAKEENNGIYIYTTNSLGVNSSHQFDTINNVYIN